MTESKKTTSRKGKAEPKAPEVTQKPLAEGVAAALPEGAVVLTIQQVQGLKQMLNMIGQPQVAWNPDVEPVAMANAIIKNSQQAAGAAMSILQQAEQGK